MSFIISVLFPAVLHQALLLRYGSLQRVPLPTASPKPGPAIVKGDAIREKSIVTIDFIVQK